MTLKSDFIIIPMREEHLKSAARIEKECFSDPWSERMLRDAVNAESGVYLAAVKDSRVCGYIGADFVLDEGYITNVAVAPEYQRKGAARALVSELISNAKQRGLSFLTLEVREGNAPAISLYHSFGFERVGKRKGYYINPAEDALLMMLYFGG